MMVYVSCRAIANHRKLGAYLRYSVSLTTAVKSLADDSGCSWCKKKDATRAMPLNKNFMLGKSPQFGGQGKKCRYFRTFDWTGNWFLANVSESSDKLPGLKKLQTIPEITWRLLRHGTIMRKVWAKNEQGR